MAAYVFSSRPTRRVALRSHHCRAPLELRINAKGAAFASGGHTFKGFFTTKFLLSKMNERQIYFKEEKRRSDMQWNIIHVFLNNFTASE
jgi:hypothetical protein